MLGLEGKLWINESGEKKDALTNKVPFLGFSISPGKQFHLTPKKSQLLDIYLYSHCILRFPSHAFRKKGAAPVTRSPWVAKL